MSRSSVFSSLASQGVTAAEFDALDVTTGAAGATTFLRGDKQWQTAGSTSASDLTSGTLANARLGPSGGITTTYVSSSTTYQLHTFTSSGTFTANSALSVDILVVGGGGSGGNGTGGGGGGAAVLYRSGLSLPANSMYTMTVGAGAARGSTSGGWNNVSGLNGGSSIFDAGGSLKVTAVGGGGGAGEQANISGVDDAANNGGNDYSTSAQSAPTGQTTPITGWTVYSGNKGGIGRGAGSNYPCGGGGGSNAVGQRPANGSSPGGYGGAGIQINITGNNYYWAGGGGGCTGNPGPTDDGGAGGDGGGGGGGSAGSGGGVGSTNGRSSGGNGYGSNGGGGNGGVNTGSGGGGGGNGGYGGVGGSGIIIIRYAL